MTKKNWNERLWDLDCVLILALYAFIVFAYLRIADITPSGNDVWGHVYKGEYMYHCLLKGDFYPLYDLKWYNGIETFRYWGPFSYYVYSITLLITHGNTVLSYQMFAAGMYFLGGLPWVIMGIISKRRVAGTAFGMLWFMLPENCHIIFSYGNVPQIVTTALTPYIILFIWLFVFRRKKPAAVGLVIFMALCTITHLMITAIIGISAFLFLLIDYLMYKRDFLLKLISLCYMVSGILLAGIWFIPALSGGMISSSELGSTSAVLLINNLGITLNPINRITGDPGDYYFGLSFVILAIFGIISSNKPNKAGFVNILIVLLLTTPSAHELISKLPFSDLFWMERFTPMAYGFFILSFMEWTSIKSKYAAGFIGLSALDALPFVCISLISFGLFDTTISDMDMLVALTENRACVLDASLIGPYPSYIIPASGKKFTYGWAWQGASTADNIMLLNEALINQRYDYVFDRCLELGDDALIIKKDLVPKYSRDALHESAARSGYAFVYESENGLFYKLDDKEIGEFGTVTRYKGISIGKYAASMTTRYPSFILGDSNFIDDYSLDELCRYHTVFLTGFEYHIRSDAEELIRAAEERGVRFVIDAAHMPVDAVSNEETFMGVTAAVIRFNNRYPTLNYRGRRLSPRDFSSENTEFGTRYIIGADKNTGSFTVGTKQLSFVGYNDDCPNVIFLGINIVYESLDMNDDVLYSITDELFDLSRYDLPDRQIVPIHSEYSMNKITIESPADNVATAYAWTDSFESDNGGTIRKVFNILNVDEGKTVVRVNYPMLGKAAGVSFAGVVFLAALIFIDRKISATYQK